MLDPECYCGNSAPYLFITRLDHHGDPIWNQPEGVLRVAICATLNCKFRRHWEGEDAVSMGERIMQWKAQYQLHQVNTLPYEIRENAQRPQFYDVAVAGANNRVGNSIGDTINLNFGLVQDYSNAMQLTFGPFFARLVDNSTDLPYHRRRQLLLKGALLDWLLGLG
ncbi:hypothetical protein GGR55DRAFT_633463 [Xylaria sp. FL0064]|nr:hypothetical protein GGR55DRAFT_633463 [Xylaria sp. FL0064]